MLVQVSALSEPQDQRYEVLIVAATSENLAKSEKRKKSGEKRAKSEKRKKGNDPPRTTSQRARAAYKFRR
jgi:hypothetical protein